MRKRWEIFEVPPNAHNTRTMFAQGKFRDDASSTDKLDNFT